MASFDRHFMRDVRRKSRCLLATAPALAACAVTCSTIVVHAHGILGDRFFPATLTTDDPFAVDELNLPTISCVRNAASGDSAASREIDAGFEFDKEIFPNFALGVSDQYIAQHGVDGGTSAYGWDNLTLTAKYAFWENEPHEAIISAGLKAAIGGTGNKAVSDAFSTLTPTFYFGKGLGDLPESLSALRPLAFTGSIGQTFPTEASTANSLDWGFAVEYSLPYLQQHVADVGLKSPLKDLIPLVEFSLSTDENRDTRGITTGSINPGIIWISKYVQLGAEAMIPINRNSGEHVGFIFQAWIFIDDLFPHAFGHPVFGDH